MRCSFIFYGSLLEEEWRRKVTQMISHNILEGYIFGDMSVISESRPEGVCRYPILNVENQTLKIAAENVTYEASDVDIEQLMQRLKDYEGPLYQLAVTSFYSQDKLIGTGFVFVENKLHVPCEAIQVERIDCSLLTFDWRQYSAQFL